MRAYAALFRIRFVNSLQYRAAAVSGVVTQFAFGFMFILAFAAFYRAAPEAFPMRFSHLVSYIWMQQAFLALFVTWYWDNDILNTVTEGSIAYELVRPVDLYRRWFVQSAANRLSRAALRCAPILAVAAALPEPYRLHLPPDPRQLLLFILSMVLTLAVVSAFSMLIYISMFHTVSTAGLRYIVAAFADFFAGQIVPLSFFPGPVRAAAELLPFAAMQNTPLRIYSGDISGNGAYAGLLLQVFWLAALYIAGRAWMSRAVNKVVVQGG